MSWSLLNADVRALCDADVCAEEFREDTGQVTMSVCVCMCVRARMCVCAHVSER